MDVDVAIVVDCKGNKSGGVADGDDKLLLKIVTKSVVVVGAKTSYASMMVGDKARDIKACPSFFGEEVIVCEEDVIVDQSSLIPSIRHVKEECQANTIKMNLGEQIDNSGIQVARSIGSDDIRTDLFGPWMLVGNRRRRMHTESRMVAGKQNVRGHELDHIIRLAPTASLKQKTTVMTREIPKNTAYLASNPLKKSSKKGILNIRTVNTVPSIAGQSVIVVEHGTKVASGAHMAVKIMEDRNGNP
ncbi:hypothetical protein V6N12_041863 [Hibiscus sabdariffa]|uniref:Uncharacterized protein n=1 Tax=Hibiscus sabdariffa TaxID=183260 RepID=A0ABR2ED42_9ROSI